MDHKITFRYFLVGYLLVISPFAVAATWYVDGIHGSDNNDCKSLQHACQTIGHAISLASSGDSIMVADATYTENLTINISLNVIGARAKTTIVDGGGKASVFAIPSSCGEEVKGSGRVTLSNMTIRNGSAALGGGICNAASLTINDSTVSGNSTSHFGGYGGGIAHKSSLFWRQPAASWPKDLRGERPNVGSPLY